MQHHESKITARSTDRDGSKLQHVQKKRKSASAWYDREPDWALFHDNQAAWREVFALCDAACQSIDIEQYIFGKRGVGKRLLALLAHKARQGVAVRVLVDGFGSRGLRESDGGRALLRSGGHIAPFHPMRDVLRRPVKALPRLHRKLLLCDGKQVMLGGSCYHDRMAQWRDTMIRLDGSPPSAISATFEQDWRDASAAHIRGNAYGEPNTDDKANWLFAASGTSQNGQHDLKEKLYHRIAAARHIVRLTTPYLLPELSLWRAIISAVNRGTEVQILVPEKSDRKLLDRLSQMAGRALSQRGVDVRTYAPRMLHAKIALVDGQWSFVSSFNLDLLSGKLNRECGVISRSASLYAALDEQLNVDVRQSSAL